MNVAQVHRNAFVLTPAEQRIMPYLTAGFTSKGIGEMLGLSEYTISCHRDQIYGKLTIRGRAQLASYALIHGMVTEEQVIDIWRQYAPHLLEHIDP